MNKGLKKYIELLNIKEEKLRKIESLLQRDSDEHYRHLIENLIDQNKQAISQVTIDSNDYGRSARPPNARTSGPLKYTNPYKTKLSEVVDRPTTKQEPYAERPVRTQARSKKMKTRERSSGE